MWPFSRRVGDVLDLDAQDIPRREFEQVNAGTQSPETRAEVATPYTTRYWLEAFLKWALDANATAIHFLRDTEDDALRQLIYHPTPEDPGRREWFEAVPMVGCFGRSGFRHLANLLGIDKRSKTGTVECVHKGKNLTATCRQESPDDVVIYFSDERPALRKKGRIH